MGMAIQEEKFKNNKIKEQGDKNEGERIVD
jgi:hypothetical protein